MYVWYTYFVHVSTIKIIGKEHLILFTLISAHIRFKILTTCGIRLNLG